jgi:hypothetical protein
VDGVLDLYESAANSPMPPPACPLVLDLDGDGVELAALNGPGSVYWDIDRDGMAEASAWIAGGDGLLCLDKNSNGVIDDHGELFGNQTGTAITNGFLALAAYDTNGSQSITAADTRFADLRVWTDANADGYSQGAELRTLSSLGITSINTTYSNVNYAISGNSIRQESTFVMGGQTRKIVDAWFAYDDVNTVYARDYTLDVRTMFLPTVRGYGKLPDLHIAMSLNEGLLQKVQAIATADRETLFNPTFNLAAKLQDALFTWAGVENIAWNSRGGNIDARELAFLEKFTGEPFFQNGGGSNPTVGAANLLESAFDEAFGNITARILLQTDAASLFTTRGTYNPVTDEFEGAFTIDLNAVQASISLVGEDTACMVI